MAQPRTITLADVNGDQLPFTGPTLGTFVSAPVAVLLTDANGNPITITGTVDGAEVFAPTPVVVCDSRGYAYNLPLTITSNGVSITITATTTSRLIKQGVGQPTPIVLTDVNGNPLTVTGGVVGSFIGAPLSAVICDYRGYSISASLAAFVLPSGAIGFWDVRNYSTSPKPNVPNSIGAAFTDMNIMNAPRRLFRNTQLWGGAALTVVDNSVVGPDGLTEASTISGTSFLIPPVTSPTGIYTMAAWVKSNTGANSTFAFRFYPGGAVQTFTATTSWQRFSLTGTLPTGGNFLFFNDSLGATINIQACDAAVYAGAVDLGAAGMPALAGHLLPATTFAPSVSAGAMDLSGGSKFCVAQFPAQTFSTMTAIVVCSKVVNDSSSPNGFLSSATNYLDFTASMDWSNSLEQVFGTKIAVNTVRFKNLATFYNQGWHTIGSRYDLANLDIWVDDIRLVSSALPGATTPSCADLVCGIVNSANYSNHKIASIALWSRALSDSEMRQAYAYMTNLASLSGYAVTAERIYVSEGDSITFGFNTTNGGFPNLYGAVASPVVHGFNPAVTGSKLAELNSRAAQDDSIIPPNKAGRKFILSVFIGANDLAQGGYNQTTFLTGYAAYLDARRAAGWLVVLCTILPSTVAGINTNRGAVNTILRTWVGSHCDALCDFANDPTMGPDAAASNLTYYQADGLHPTDAGQALLEAVLAPVVNGL